jgi:gamma-glutamyltranspeptidase / glutathione hydrolase
MQGAIKVARYGWPVNEDLIMYMDFAESYAGNFLVDDPSWAIDFAPTGTRVALGDIITRKRYADTLETIANEGPDAFYTGKIAESMINALTAANGTMTLQDLKDYKAVIRTPSNITYRGFRLHSCSNPSGGEVALAVLKTVEGYDDFFHPGNVNLSTHRLDEAMRFAYGARSNLGDPAYVKGMVEFQDDLLSSERAKHIRSKINDKHTLNISAYNPSGFEIHENHGTSQVVTADASGMAITLTTTVNLLFGSALMVPETGIIMNNEQNDFSIPGYQNEFGYPPSPANYVRPGKRPLSSITPVIAEWPNGTLYYVIGSAGGSRIITTTIQNLVHVLDRNMTTLEALAQPRMHDQLIPNLAYFEDAYDNGTVAFMRERGHNVTNLGVGMSSAQGIRMLPNGTFEAAGEPRQKNSGGFAV